MVTVCQKCGDRGFVEAFIYCDKCQNYALHRYCHDGPAENIFDEDLTWLCVDCEPKIVKALATKSTNRKKVKKKRYRFTAKKYPAKKKTQKREGAKTDLQICEASPSEHEAEGSNNCENDRMNQCALVLRDHCKSPNDDVAKCVQTSQITTTDLLKITEHDSYVAAQPIIDPIWKGSLSIFNKDFSNVSGLVAHLSSLACPKVREEADLLPLLLIPELVHRTDVWPKAFEKCGPSDESIALYFFPGNERDEKDFDSLVSSMIQDDLALKAVLENAELLVFPSVILPEICQRFRSKIYLWGVFRAKQFLQLTNGIASSGEKDLASTLTSYVQSPVSTLSNDVDISCDNPEPLNSYCPSVM